MGRQEQPMVSRFAFCLCSTVLTKGSLPGVRTKARQAECWSLIISPLAVIGNVEAFEFGLLRRPEAYDEVDELVEDRRADP
jgi:hypothetical protein